MLPAEAAFYNKVHTDLASAVPHGFYDWKIDTGPDDFDALKLWCADAKTPDDHLGYCPVRLGKSEPYSLKYEIEFNMPDAQSKALLESEFKKITDFNSTRQIAAALKSTAVRWLKISIATNVLTAANNRLSYCAGIQPKTITLPVPPALALMGLHSDDCPIMVAGRIDMTADYYDNALIILGKPPARRSVEQRSGGLAEMDCGAGFDQSKTGRLETQNIVVSIHGDAADISAAIKLIDWQKLCYLLGK